MLLVKGKLSGLSRGQRPNPGQGSKILTNADSTGAFSRHPGGNRKARKRVSCSRSLSKNSLPLSAYTVDQFAWSALENQDQETREECTCGHTGPGGLSS